MFSKILKTILCERQFELSRTILNSVSSTKRYFTFTIVCHLPKSSFFKEDLLSIP